ncbi:polycystin-1-like protein 2 [Glandiceps talaboti]
MRVVEYAGNPFVWDDSFTTVNSPVLSLDFYDSNITEVAIESLSEPNPILTTLLDISFAQGGGLLNETFADPNDTIVAFRADLTDAVRFSLDSSDEDQTEAVTVVNSTTEGGLLNETSDNLTSTVAPNKSFKIGYDPNGIPSAKIFIPHNTFNFTGLCYIMMQIQNISNETLISVFNYSLEIAELSCRYWDPENETWQTSGCQAEPESTLTKTVCSCTHLTNFGAGNFYTPVNKIDFDTVFEKFLSLNENPVVFSVVICIFVFYLLLLWFLRKQDRKDQLRWSLLPLIDNNPEDNYHYEMIVNTGMRSGASTRSNISFKLTGEHSDTGTRVLKDNYGKKFAAGSVNRYLLSVSRSLGAPTHLRIWHDSSGIGDYASWYLQHVTIRDLQTGKRYYFICENWLSLTEGDGKIARSLGVSVTEAAVKFKTLFGRKSLEGLTDEHIWFSMFQRPTKSTFTRVQRLTCSLSILFSYLLVNAMFYRSSEGGTKTGSFAIGPITISLRHIYIGVMSAFFLLPVSLVIVAIFRHSKQRNKVTGTRKDSPSEQNKVEGKSDSATPVDESNNTKKQKQKCGLPWWFVYVGWVYAILSTLACAFFVILYSLQWGSSKSQAWLVSCVTSLLQSIFLIEPGKIILLSMVFAFVGLVKKKTLQSLDIIDDDPPSEQKDKKTSEPEPHKIQGDPTGADTSAVVEGELDEAQVEVSRLRLVKESKMCSILNGVGVYTLFIIAIMVLSTNVTEPHSHYLVKAVKDSFNMKSIPHKNEDVLKWFQDALVPTLYTKRLYNGKLANLSTIFGDGLNYRIGSPRLRQQRYRKSECLTTVERGSAKEIGCKTDTDGSYYSDQPKPVPVKNQDINGGVRRRSVPVSITPNTSDYWNEHLVEHEYTIRGVHDSYNSRGLVANLGRSRESALRVTDKLLNVEWIDRFTQVMMFEMTLYNPAYSMFSSVVIIFEFPLQGGIDTTIDIQVLRLLQNMTFDQIDFLLFICLGVLLIVTIVKAVSVVKAIVRQKVKYLKDFWNWLEFGIVVCSIITFIMAITSEVISSQDLSQYSAEKHIQIRHITELYKIYSTALSLVVFMSILRYLQLLRFNKRLLLLSTTLKFAWLNMKGFFWVYLVVTLAFAHMGNIAMGKIIEAFSTMESSLSYLLTISVGSSRYFDAITVLMPRFGEMFLMVYTLFMITFILNIFIAIITEAYESAKDYLEQQQNQFEMVDYMKQRFKDTAYMQFGVDLAVLSTKG